MSNLIYVEEKENIKINNKNFSVVTRIPKKSLSKESLINLIVEYAMRELNQEDL